jgi:hypothetical protein
LPRSLKRKTKKNELGLKSFLDLSPSLGSCNHHQPTFGITSSSARTSKNKKTKKTKKIELGLLLALLRYSPCHEYLNNAQKFEPKFTFLFE